MELADEVKELLEQRRIEMGHARALLGLTSRRQQIEVAGLVAKKSLSVRDTEALVRRIMNPQPPTRRVAGARIRTSTAWSASWRTSWAPK